MMSAVFQIRYIFVPKLLLFVTNCFCNTFCEKSRLIFYVSGLKEELSTKHCVKSVQIRSFFWSVFYHIRTEYGEILSTFSYSVRMRENKDQKKLRIWALFTQCLAQTLTSTKMQRCIQNPVKHLKGSSSGELEGLPDPHLG